MQVVSLGQSQILVDQTVVVVAIEVGVELLNH